MKKVLSPAAVSEIWRLREELDDWGGPKWSGEYIASQLGVSESTVWRVLRKRAAYRTEGPAAQALARAQAMEADTLGVERMVRPDLDARARESAKLMMKRLGPVDPLSEEGDGSGLSELEARAQAYGVDIERLRAPIIRE